VDAFEQAGDPGAERVLEVVGGDMDMPCRVECVWIDAFGAQVRDRARTREDRAVVRPGEDDRQPRRPIRLDDEPRDVHASALELISHETPEDVVADDAADRGPKAEPCGTAREDRARAADGELRLLDDPLDLPERRFDIAHEDEVGVDVAQHQQVDRIRHGRTIAEEPEHPAATRGRASIVRP
jgi:hypothetical protein